MTTGIYRQAWHITAACIVRLQQGGQPPLPYGGIITVSPDAVIISFFLLPYQNDVASAVSAGLRGKRIFCHAAGHTPYACTRCKLPGIRGGHGITGEIFSASIHRGGVESVWI